ncbi:hypothetical protein MMC21_001310 [Puttea exsequens]|nr:hypothetical protein [Puttea exsequens]
MPKVGSFKYDDYFEPIGRKVSFNNLGAPGKAPCSAFSPTDIDYVYVSFGTGMRATPKIQFYSDQDCTHKLGNSGAPEQHNYVGGASASFQVSAFPKHGPGKNSDRVILSARVVAER